MRLLQGEAVQFRREAERALPYAERGDDLLIRAEVLTTLGRAMLRVGDTEGEELDDEEDASLSQQISEGLDKILKSKSDTECLSPVYSHRCFINREEIGYECMQLYGDADPEVLEFTFSQRDTGPRIETIRKTDR